MQNRSERFAYDLVVYMLNRYFPDDPVWHVQGVKLRLWFIERMTKVRDCLTVACSLLMDQHAMKVLRWETWSVRGAAVNGWQADNMTPVKVEPTEDTVKKEYIEVICIDC